MPLKVEKQPKETSQSLIHRFSQKIKRSGILLEARKKMFYKKGKSKQLKRRSALRRIQKKEEFKKLKKMGRL